MAIFLLRRPSRIAPIKRLAGVFLLCLAPPASPNEDHRSNTGVAEPPRGLIDLQRYDQRLNAIGFRLAVAGSDFCANRVSLIGLAFHDLTQYSAAQETEARKVFGFAGQPLVLAVAPGSPAEAAGIEVGDTVVQIDGEPVSAVGADTHASFARAEALLSQVETALAIGPIDLKMEHQGRRLDVRLVGRPGCATRFQTKASSIVDGKANGTYVEMNTGLMDFARDDDELAAIVAHELAHNILGHRTRLDQAGAHRGLLGQFGRSASLVHVTEEEADRLSVYLLDRAGYRLNGGIAFLAQYRATHPLSLLGAPTHPAIGTRIRLMQREISRIQAMKAAGKRPEPEPLGVAGSNS